MSSSTLLREYDNIVMSLLSVKKTLDYVGIIADETTEVQTLCENLLSDSDRLLRIIMKRAAGDIQENDEPELFGCFDDGVSTSLEDESPSQKG